MTHRANWKRRSVRKFNGDFDAIRKSWIEESLAPKVATPQHGEVSVQRRGTFFLASFAKNNNVVRGLSHDLREAITRCRLLGRTI